MADPNTTPGHSTKFGYGSVGSSSVTDIAQILEISPPEIEADDIETSSMSTPDQFKTFDPGWADAGEVEVTLQYEKSVSATLYGLFRQKKGFKITFEDNSAWTFDEYVKKFGGEIDREDVVTQTITVKISGKPTFTAGGSGS